MSDASSPPTLSGVEAAAVISRLQGRRFMLFLAPGGFAALVNLVSRYLLSPIVGFKTSIILAYAIGMVVAFVFSAPWSLVVPPLESSKKAFGSWQ